jgi:hypothetical protein
MWPPKTANVPPASPLTHKDWPVFGEASVYAAYCSFAAAREGKYAQAHYALIGSKRDLDSKEDVQQVLLLIIGKRLVPGGLDYSQLVRLVAEERSAH